MGFFGSIVGSTIGNIPKIGSSLNKGANAVDSGLTKGLNYGYKGVMKVAGKDCAGFADYQDTSQPDLKTEVDVEMGDKFTNTKFCGHCGRLDPMSVGSLQSTATSMITGQGPSTPCGDNGEFSPGPDSGQKCNCDSSCDNGCCRKTCVRVAYTGDENKCCTLGGPSYYIENNIVHTCDPKYRAKNLKDHGCDNSLKDYCTKGNNLFGPTCRNWVTTFNNRGGQTSETGGGSGIVDSVLSDVCLRPENKNNEACDCITSAKELADKLPSAKSIPVNCLYNKCANNGKAYATTSQLSPCTTVQCVMDISDASFVINNASEFSANFVQNCNANVKSGGENVVSDSNKTGSIQTIGSPSSGNLLGLKWYFWVIIGVVLIAIFFWVFSPKSSSTGQSGGTEMFKSAIEFFI